MSASKDTKKVVHSFVDRFPAYAAYSVTAATVVYVVNEAYANDFTHAEMPFLQDPQWMHVAPPLFLVPYVLMVHVLGPLIKKKIKANQEAADAFWVPIARIWNLFLTVLSFTMLFGLLHGLYAHASQHVTTVHDFVCDPTLQRWNGSLMFWIWLFALSKFTELFDTVILVFRGKTPNFLHWFHHVTVLVYTWYAVLYRFTPGYIFGSVNCLVHSVMYDYYKVAMYGIKLSYAKAVTQLQIIQMFAGIGIVGYWTYVHYQNPAICPGDNLQSMILGAVVMYGSYLFLFVAFYVNRYNAAKQKKKDGKKSN